MVLAGWHTYDHYAYALIAVLGTAAAVVGTQWFIQHSRWSDWARSLQGVVPPFINILGVLFGLTLAFLANDTWSAHDQATRAVYREADALQSLAGHRRQQVWEAAARHKAPPLLREAPVHEQILLLPAAPEADEITIDYAATGLTLRRHPLALLRSELTQRRLHSAAALQGLSNGKPARACGLVTMRQQPETAKGTIFVSIEDETGSVNVVVWHSVRDQCRAALLQSQLLAVHGTWQNVDGVCNLVAHHLENLTPLLEGLNIHSRDFH